MGNPTRDLDRWMPRLVAVWRRAFHRKPGPEHLTPPELREVAAGVRALSKGLTRERALAGGRYMDDPKLLGAYLLFYWPVSYAQGRALFGELPGRPRRVLDLGCGPGPLSFAAQDFGAQEVVAADRSRAALKIARELATEAGEALAAREWDPKRELPEGPFDWIVAGHLLNELYGGSGSKSALEQRAALLERAGERLRPSGTLLVIEPALRETSRGLLEVRDLLVAKGWAVRAPCLFRGPCPALTKPTDWCHAERSWSQPSQVESLARAAGLHKEALKMSYLALAAPGEAWATPPPGSLFRIVSEPLKGKGRARFMGCGPEGRIGLALQDKHRTEANARFFGLRRGEVIAVEGTEPRGDGLALGETSSVRPIASPGEPVPYLPSAEASSS